MKKLLESQKGFTGIEISVALVILMIFVSLISTIFINVYLTFTDAQRNSAATGFATQIAETINEMYYAEVDNTTLADTIQNMSIPSGYIAKAEVTDYIPEGQVQNLVKTVVITVSYKVGNNAKTVQIETIKSKEILITPNKPKLSSGMVPVKYIETSNDGYWVITTEEDSTWYNYDNKRWANVMLQDGLTVEGDIKVNDENRKNLVGKKITTLGSMFVWIPRYAYKIPEENLHTSTAGEIDIIFLYSTSDNYVDENGNLQPIIGESTADYKIHPSFKNDEENNYINGGWDTELTGYWVAKFEASSNNPNAQYGGGNDTDLKVKVLPNVPSWRDINVNNMFLVCRNMIEDDNDYSISNNVEPHMMKNTEWGAVTYLANSKYGINEQVWINPYFSNGATSTGKVASTAGANATQTTECDEYNKGNGPKGSTTGNVYGIYDMAGGGLEYVAGFIDNGVSAEKSSKISTLINLKGTKYVDVYEIGDEDKQKLNYDKNASKYGDAIYETSADSQGNTSWYEDISVYLFGEERLIFYRGGSYTGGNGRGIYYFSGNTGAGSQMYSFRPVITIP